MRSEFRGLLAFLFLLLLVGVVALPTRAALFERVNEAFSAVHKREPTFAEWQYWANRVVRGEKKTFDALVGAIGYQYAETGRSTAPATLAPGVTAAKSFAASSHIYPSTAGPNFLPDGTLVKSVSRPEVFYIQNGKKSWIIPSVINKWLGENHFYKHDLIITIPDADLARYPQVSSVNPVYIGKVLQHPNGQQFYIDDKLRKRQISAAVRGALKFPAGNLYPTSDVHLREFKSGPAITRADIQPGGMVIYDGPYHGGRIWRVEEAAGGKLVKRLFLSDYLYEAYYYPDESQRVGVSATELARYPRASNIERYPDGWVVGIGSNIYVVQNGALRLVTSPSVFAAMGHNSKYVLKVFPEFLRRYPHGQPISAFKTIVSASTASRATPGSAPTITSTYTKVRPAIRTLIARLNTIYITVYDKDITPAENKFWVDYVYNGEVTTEAQLIAAMRKAKSTGVKPSRTSRTAVLSESTLEQKWFPYLFYFVWQRDPNEDDKDYWYSRIHPGDRDSIEKLGGTLQWLKETSDVSHK